VKVGDVPHGFCFRSEPLGRRRGKRQGCECFSCGLWMGFRAAEVVAWIVEGVGRGWTEFGCEDGTWI